MHERRRFLRGLRISWKGAWNATGKYDARDTQVQLADWGLYGWVPTTQPRI
jgi:hypothetical protein